MMRFLALALLLAFVPTPPAAAAAAKVEVANGDWSFLPVMKKRSNDHLSNKAIFRIHEIVTERQCTLPVRLVGTLVEFDLSFAAHFSPDGTLNRVVLPRLGCPEAEGIIGGVLLKMIEGGDYRPDGSNPEGWYRGDLSFTVSG